MLSPATLTVGWGLSVPVFSGTLHLEGDYRMTELLTTGYQKKRGSLNPQSTVCLMVIKKDL